MNTVKTSTMKPPALNKAPAPVMGHTTSAAGFTDYLNSSGRAGGEGGGGGSNRFVPHPPVFRDLSDLDTPDDLRGLFRACRFLARYSGVHKSFVTAMSTFPLTDIILRSPGEPSDAIRNAASTSRTGVRLGTNDDTTLKWYKLVTRHWKLKEVNQKAAHHFYTYSNVVLTISFPFIKMLKCSSCEHEVQAQEPSVEWTLLQEGRFNLTCPRCRHTGVADAWDRWIDVPEDIRLIVLDTERVYSRYNEFRDEVNLYYELSEEFIRRLTEPPADRSLVCDTPQPYLEAAMGKKVPGWIQTVTDRPVVRLRKDQCYLMKADTLPAMDTGLAFPEMAASLKEYWLLRLLQKSQEAIASDFIVPMRFVYPESSSKSGNLFEMINVQHYMEVLKQELAKHRQDPNYIGSIPFPVGYQALSGEGKGLNLSQEIRIIMEMMVASLGAPLEFLFGGLSYSGSNVSIKQQEVKFQNFREKLLDMNRWFGDAVASQMNLSPVVLEHAEFKMGDDMQQTQLLMAMQAANVASLKRVHDNLGWDYESEKKQILGEQRWHALVQEERSKADLDMAEHQVIRQTSAQAEGMVRGTERQLHARLELANAVRRDQELYNSVISDPQLVYTVFGAMSPEALNINRQVRMNPDAHVEAPGAEEARADENVLDRSGEPNLLDPGHLAQQADNLMPLMPQFQEAQAQAAPAMPDARAQANQITSYFNNLDPSEWAGALTQVRQQFGDEVAQHVNANLSNAQVMLMQAPDDLPERRDSFHSG